MVLFTAILVMNGSTRAGDRFWETLVSGRCGMKWIDVLMSIWTEDLLPYIPMKYANNLSGMFHLLWNAPTVLECSWMFLLLSAETATVDSRRQYAGGDGELVATATANIRMWLVWRSRCGWNSRIWLTLSSRREENKRASYVADSQRSYSSSTMSPLSGNIER